MVFHALTNQQDMLSRVRSQRPSYNNRSWISSRVAVSRAKVLYYRAFAVLYGIAGSFASVVMVNSSWTRKHIAAVWRLSSPTVVFPPCDTAELEVGQDIQETAEFIQKTVMHSCFLFGY